MNCAPRLPICASSKPLPRAQQAFTLVEVLAALLFLAVVIPVAVEGLRVAHQVGEVGQRRSIALRIADRALNEWVATAPSGMARTSGSALEGPAEFRWSLRTSSWAQDADLREAVVTVTYFVQGRENIVQLTTLVGSDLR